MDKQAVTEGLKFVEGPNKCFGGGALHERASLRVNRRAEEIVGRCIADVEMNGGIESCQFDELWLAKGAIFMGWGCCEGFRTEVRNGTDRSDENLLMSVEVGSNFRASNVAHDQDAAVARWVQMQSQAG